MYETFDHARLYLLPPIYAVCSQAKVDNNHNGVLLLQRRTVGRLRDRVVNEKNQLGLRAHAGFKKETPQISVRVYPERDGPLWAHSPSLRNRHTYYIVDPGKTKTSCDPSSSVEPKSYHSFLTPNSNHWGGAQFRKLRGVGNIRSFYTCLRIIRKESVCQPC